MKAKVSTLIALMLVTSASSSPAAENLSSLATPIARGAQSDESAYFVMIDRFSNGDSSNDAGGLKPDLFESGFNPASDVMYHGGDFAGMTSKLDYLKNLGFTSVWITPPVKQQTVQGGSSAFHGYWGLDFTTIDPHYGSESDFKKFVDAAHSKGMKVIMDIVVNHTADVIQYSTDNNYIDHKTFPYKDIDGNPFDPAKYAGQSNFPKLSPTKSFAKQPSIPESLANAKSPSFLNDITNYHNRGDSTWSGTSVLDGDFMGLDDIFTEKPEVVAGWIKVWSDWISNFGIDGFRIDTAKHVNPEFWREFIPAILKTAKSVGKTDFPIYGEIFDSNPIATSKFVREQSFPGVLDFPFQSVITNFITSDGGAENLIDLFNADDLYTTSSTSAYGLTTFLGNHDMGRIGMFVAGSANGDPQVILAKAKLANALLFLLRGGPALYYGDEKGFAGSGGDAQARQDMFATAVNYWQDENRIGSDPIGTRSSFDVKNPLEEQISQMQQVIAKNPALRSGTQQIRFASGSLFAVTRYLKGQEYIVVYNAGAKSAEAKFKTSTLGAKWQLILGNTKSHSFAKNNASVVQPGYSYSVFKAINPVKPSSKPTIKLNAPRSDYALDYLLEISAAVPGDDYNQVTFLMRESGKKWINLGTSDRRTFKSRIADGGLYRVYIEPRNYPSGTQLEFVAIAKNEANKSATSKVVKFNISN